MRWMELNAFSDAVYRSHQGNRPHHNAQVWDDEEIIGQLAWCTSMHIALLEYKREAIARGGKRRFADDANDVHSLCFRRCGERFDITILARTRYANRTGARS